MLKKLVAEFVGTFFLVFTVGQVVIEPDAAGAFAGLAIGSILAIMVYATGHVSGGHLNPAVTLGVFLRGRATGAELIAYWVAQLVAGVVAALAVLALKGAAATPAAIETMPVFLAEFLFTFALVFVVLSTATSRATEGNSYFGAAIGGTVMVGAYAVGPVSGAAFNPAVAGGGILLGLIGSADLWIYLVATLAGGAAAALVFRALDLGGDADAADAAA